MTYTGLAPVTSRAADEMLAGTLWSLGIALASVSLFAAFAFRTRRTQICSVAAGMTCLLPVLLPVAVVLGVLAGGQFASISARPSRSVWRLGLASGSRSLYGQLPPISAGRQ